MRYASCTYAFDTFFFQAKDGIRDLVRSRGLGDVYKRQVLINNGADIHIKSNYENTPLDDAESDELKLLM